MKIKILPTAFALVLMISTGASAAQQRGNTTNFAPGGLKGGSATTNFYSPGGAKLGSVTTSPGGGSTFYNSRGSVAGRAFTSSNQTTIYDPTGRNVGSYTKGKQ